MFSCNFVGGGGSRESRQGNAQICEDHIESKMPCYRGEDVSTGWITRHKFCSKAQVQMQVMWSNKLNALEKVLENSNIFEIYTLQCCLILFIIYLYLEKSPYPPQHHHYHHLTIFMVLLNFEK